MQEVSKQFNQSLTMQCSLELVTCPSCIIKVSFEYMNFPTSCPNAKNGAGICRCDYLIISEPPYDDMQKNIVYNCGDINEYQSKTRTLQIRFIYWNNYTDAFRMKYSVEGEFLAFLSNKVYGRSLMHSTKELYCAHFYAFFGIELV